MDTIDHGSIWPAIAALHWPDDDIEFLPEFPVSLDETPCRRKPTKGEFAGICTRIAHNPRQVSIPDLARFVTHPYGYSWCAGVYDLAVSNGSKDNRSWLSQYFFAIDCDGAVPFTWQEALDRCKQYGVDPCIIYTTFSAKEEERYRLVFVVSCVVDDERVRNTINRLLLELFPECDQSTKDAARIITGGRKLLHVDNDGFLDIERLVDGAHTFWLERDPSNYARRVKRIAGDLGLNITTTNVLDIDFVHPDEVEDYEHFDASPASENQLQNGGRFKMTKWRWDFNSIMSHHRFVTFGLVLFGFDGEGDGKAVEPSKDLSNHTKKKHATDGWRNLERLNNPNWDRLYGSCSIFRSFRDDERKFTNNELFVILTNLCLLKGGAEVFRKVVISSQHDYDLPKIEAMISYVQKRRYCPVSYSRGFPDVQTPFTTMYHAALPDYGKIIQTAPARWRDLVGAEEELSEEFERAVARDGPGLTVLKASTGIGKSECILRSIRRGVIAFPRHDLLQSMDARFQEGGADPLALPAFPCNVIPSEYQERVFELWRAGCYAQAQEFLRTIDMMGWSRELRLYLEAKERLKNITKTDLVLTTHVGAVNSTPVHDTIVFDEDPIETILPIRQVSEKDVRRLRTHLICWMGAGNSDSDLSGLATDVLRWCDALLRLEADEHTHAVIPVVMRVECLRFRLEELIFEAKVESNVLMAIEATYIVVLMNGNDRVFHTICRRALPVDRNVIILSATADRWLYQRLFGVHLHKFYDTGLIEARGRIVQYHSRSFSRSCMAQCTGLNSFLDDEFGREVSRITFRGYEAALEADMHFGATSGMNELTGKDLVIIGTPHKHPVVYRLIAAALGESIGPNDLQMVNQQVERNGLRFWFFTYRNEVLRNVHLHLVEAELLQAVGRARHLRHDVTITVFSNYPIPGAEYRPLPPEWWERMTQENESRQVAPDRKAA